MLDVFTNTIDHFESTKETGEVALTNARDALETATEALETAKNNLTTYQKAISDGLKTISDAQSVLNDRESKLADAQKALSDANKKLADAQKAISDAQIVLNDKEFALSFARSHVATKPCGELLLRQELKKKGISDELINCAVEEAYKEKPQTDLAHFLAIKKKRQFQNLEEIKAKKRTSDFLLRRGFSWDIVSAILDNWQNLNS